MKFCVKDNNYFKFNNEFYQQTFGMPMGNPLSPTIADIILAKLLDYSVDILSIKNVVFKYIAKYVDNIFAIIKRKDADIILKTLNEYQNKLQFTIEHEQNNSIAFLDIKSNYKLVFKTYVVRKDDELPVDTTTKSKTISHDKFKDDNIKKIRTSLRNKQKTHTIRFTTRRFTIFQH